MFNLNCFINIPSLILFSGNVRKKIEPTRFAFCWPCDLQSDKVHQKWYKLTEVNGAYKHGSYDRNVGWKKVCIVHPVLKFLPHKMAGQPAGQTELTTYFMLLIWINKTTKQNHKFKYACIGWSKVQLLIKKSKFSNSPCLLLTFW